MSNIPLYDPLDLKDVLLFQCAIIDSVCFNLLWSFPRNLCLLLLRFLFWIAVVLLTCLDLLWSLHQVAERQASMSLALVLVVIDALKDLNQDAAELAGHIAILFLRVCQEDATEDRHLVLCKMMVASFALATLRVVRAMLLLTWAQ